MRADIGREAVCALQGRVLIVPANMCPAREAEGRETPDVFSWGYPFFGQAKKGYEK